MRGMQMALGCCGIKKKKKKWRMGVLPEKYLGIEKGVFVNIIFK